MKKCRDCEHWTIEEHSELYLPADRDGYCDEINGHSKGINIIIKGDATHEMTTSAIFGCNLFKPKG